jgi:acetyl-CoA carboxylase biotin carboxyl carrier protein
MEIQEGEEAIRLSRGGPAPVYAPAPVAAPVVSAPIAPVVEAVSEATSTENALTSPMVGSFYIAPKPGDPDFVKIGDTVAVGDVLCIIEAMKIFNQIEADRAGKVTHIFKESGDPVEYGEPLFTIE